MNGRDLTKVDINPYSKIRGCSEASLATSTAMLVPFFCFAVNYNQRTTCLLMMWVIYAMA